MTDDEIQAQWQLAKELYEAYQYHKSPPDTFPSRNPYDNRASWDSLPDSLGGERSHWFFVAGVAISACKKRP